MGDRFELSDARHLQGARSNSSERFEVIFLHRLFRHDGKLRERVIVDRAATPNSLSSNLLPVMILFLQELV